MKPTIQETEKKGYSISELWDKLKEPNNIRVIGILAGGRFEKISKNFLNLVKMTNLQIQGAQQTPSSRNEES